MSSAIHSVKRPAIQVRTTPWLAFLFLAITLFFVYHDFANSRNGIGNYDAAEAAIVAMVEGSVSRRIALVSLAIFALVVLMRYRHSGLSPIQGTLAWLFLAFCAWAMVSPGWAEDRALTVTRVAVFGILCLLAIAMTRRFSLREIILWTFFASGSYLAVGLVAEVIFGTFRPITSGYRFAGTLHPNEQGINCALLVLSGVAMADLAKGSSRVFFRLCAFCGFSFLTLTASRTAFASALLSLAAYAMAACSRRMKIAMAYVGSIVFCVLLMVLGNAFLPDLRSAVMLGRDDSNISSFNGRTGIWSDIGDYFERRPIAGYGYDAFWTPTHVSEISKDQKWAIPNSHSAYLDYLLTLGLVGLIVYVLLLLEGVRRAFRLYQFYREPAFAFCGATLVFCAFNGFLESAVSEPSLVMLLAWVILAHLAFRYKANFGAPYTFRISNLGAPAR